MLLILLMNALLALLFTFDKEMLYYMPPMIFLASRTMVCGAIFGGYFLVKDWGAFKVTWSDLFTALALSFFNIYLANLFFFTSLQTLSSAKASLIYNSKPFIVAILAYIFLKDSLSWLKIAGMVVGWIGFMPIFLLNNPTAEGASLISWGEIFAFGTACSVAISYLLYHKIMTKKHSSISFTSAINLFAGGSFALINVYLFELNPTVLATLKINQYSILLFVIVVVITLGWALSFTHLTGIYPSAFLAATGFTAPLFTAFFEWLFFGRTVSYTFYITLTCIAIGLYMIYQAEKGKLKTVELQEMEID